uniref:DNA/RNA-binding protein Alba-like domain-containing protein n=1 Tax=Aegilops tauschii subsp. strangulata TaxID=200361 RepID=A0A453HBV3_AEGTS
PPGDERRPAPRARDGQVPEGGAAAARVGHRRERDPNHRPGAYPQLCLLRHVPPPEDRKIKEIVLKAMGQAISKSVAVTEIIKKRVPGLYQDTNISSVSITDVWEPIEEGLVPLEMTRHVSMISITLSPVDLDQNSPGYQSPAYVDQPRQQQRLQQAPAPLRQPRQQPSDYDGMIVIVRTCFCTSVVQTYHDCCSVRLLCEGSWQRKGPWTW